MFQRHDFSRGLVGIYKGEWRVRGRLLWNWVLSEWEKVSVCSTILFSLLSRNLSLSNEIFLPRYFNLEGYLFAWTEEVSLTPLFMKNTPNFSEQGLGL
jgi:hypothetical protein